MKKITVCLALVGLLAMGGTALAEIGAIDNVPAATLLLPYFEVDISAPGGVNTLFSVNNASAASVLAHVTVWTDRWVPVLDFDIYLTGYDVQTISLFQLIASGDLPNTGATNTLSPVGDFSLGHINFPGCSITPGSAPNYANIGGLFLQSVQAALTGAPLPTSGLCAGTDHGDGLARGYITVDVVTACDILFPDAVTYFIDGGNGIATNDNVLWGDYFLVDEANNFAQGEPLVHIEAAAELGALNGSCDITDRNPTTFYCTVASPAGTEGEDNREGLPSIFGARYLAGGAFDGGTDFTAWRDKLGSGSGTPFVCGTGTPTDQNQIVVFDEQENPITTGQGPSGAPEILDVPFPWCTNRATVGLDITIDAPFGWVYMNLNGGGGFPGFFRQAWVTAIMSAEGRFSVGFDALQFNNLTLGTDTNDDPTLPLFPPTLTSGNF